jgi:undecaprenyl diphosphate synthase
MDGNGRWAHARGLPRIEGHRAGEASLMDVLHGAIELGVPVISAYAFSTENWRRSPEEVRFLMGFNKDVIRRRRDELAALGVRIRWAGRRPRLWRSVINQLEDAEQYTRDNDRLTLQFCVNYGGRAELVDAMRSIAREVEAGRLNPAKIDERTVTAHLDDPGLPDVDLFIRTSGEQRTSNFLLWQSAYAELAFVDTLWPDFDRRHLWHACLEYAKRDRRFGRSRTGESSRRSRTGESSRRRRSRRGARANHPTKSLRKRRSTISWGPRMIAISHFSDSGADFAQRAQNALAALAVRPGYLRGTLGRCADDPGAWVLLTEWENIGSYRRALGGYDVKLLATPLLASALDLPAAFEPLLDVAPGGAAVTRESDREQ